VAEEPKSDGLAWEVFEKWEEGWFQGKRKEIFFPCVYNAWLVRLRALWMEKKARAKCHCFFVWVTWIRFSFFSFPFYLFFFLALFPCFYWKILLVINFGSVWFLYKKIIKLICFWKKIKPNQNRFKPTGFDSVF
jgi:hypothetical protein